MAVTVLPIRELQMLNSIWGDNPESSGLVPNEFERELRELFPVREDMLLRLLMEEFVPKSESKDPPKGEELLLSESEFENNEDRSGRDICARSSLIKSGFIDVADDVAF